MKLEKQVQLLEQCGDPATMDRMMKVLVNMLLDVKSTADIAYMIGRLQTATNKARARQTKENLLHIK